jgi:O-antigen ligase/polysaccharide polymerase Wzy-like membrane protein
VTALAGRARPVWALYVFVAGLALHNFVMAELWDAGVRGTALTVVSAWKEVLLLVALVLVVLARGRFPFDGALTDWLAVAYGTFVVVYALIPQSTLGGTATRHGVLLGVRHDLVPVAAYFLGRGLDLTQRDLRRIGALTLGTAAAVAAFGLVDIYAIPLSWWRSSGAPGWFRDQLGFVYTGLSGLPQNFVYNTGNEQPLRRLVSTFLSPLATSYLLVVALLLCAAWLVRLRPRRWRLALWAGTALLLLAGLLWTHSRSSYIALAVGLLAFAWARRADGARTVVGVVAAAVAVLVLGVAFVEAYSHIAPTTRFTPSELVVQRANAATGGPAITGAEDASLRSHWRSLRSGVRTVLHHPQGFGVGNAGSTAARTHVAIRAGESTYTELGVDVGLAGGLVFVAWSLALAWAALRCSAWIGGSLVAVLALGVQTDVIGVPWLAYVVWALAGATVRRTDL